jgi:hypothetical protein
MLLAKVWSRNRDLFFNRTNPDHIFSQRSDSVKMHRTSTSTGDMNMLSYSIQNVWLVYSRTVIQIAYKKYWMLNSVKENKFSYKQESNKMSVIYDK